MTDHLVALGVAPAGTEWFRDLGRWAATGEVPVELVRCVGIDEVRRRLLERPWSVVVVDTASPGLDRDLVATAEELDVPVVGVRSTAGADGPPGLRQLLDAPLTVAETTATLLEVARSIPAAASLPEPPHTQPPVDGSGRLVAVTGPGGAGSSVLAMALAQHLGDVDHPDEVLLADLALHADLGMFHAATDVVPGLQELVEAHQVGRPAPASLDELTWASPDRGYRLLLGLRRHRDWTVLRPRAFEAPIDSLLARHRLVVADVEADLEGVDETGSTDIADRNLAARAVTARADIVVAVGDASLHGVQSLSRTLGDLLDHGIEPERILTVVNRAPRSRRRRAAITRAIGDLVAARRAAADGVAGTLHIAISRSLETALVDPARLPGSFASSLGPAVRARLDGVPPRSGTDELLPEPIAPGSLGLTD
ncbi:MAG: hypothetical protein AAGF02_00675 [Actinomycetota bacterium]